MSFEVDYYALGMRIRAAREKKFLTQEQLGEMCSLSTAHIGHIERGTRTPSVDTLCSISSALNVSLDSLLLDNFESDDKLSHLSAILQGKDPDKVKRFITMITAMAEKIDEI
ncbi:MAG: helix-turn-helix transcriptional regulator [Clostridia bacterium]|nr:helix-turn-helix transcriptional regulator [Clostridia bacterium]MBR0349978.1 helix-turn-helix transcriptional regulator [Clostridia bacterium]